MGRKHNLKWKKNNSKGNKKNVRNDNKAEWLENIVKENKALQTFYENQSVIPPGEFDDFWAAMKRELPHAFRLSGNKREADILRKIMEERYFPGMTNVEVDGFKIELPSPLNWYPDNRGYQMNVSRKYIRKSEALNQFHNFLISETEMGEISQSETVSMIPPLLLDIQPHCKVLDMCAAPGSKTAQIIEMLHSHDSHKCPSGFVVANDADNKRCYLLVHQSLKRLQSPCCIVTNHDASTLPAIKSRSPNGDVKKIEFDRILCDVPCSGDGTTRKNLDIWKSWNPNSSYNLHTIQTRIARRGLEILTVGGRMVYSTCSLNPTEDEAVVVQLLEMCQGAVELVDVSDQLPGLIRSPGVNHWKIMDRECTFFDSFEDVPVTSKRHTSALKQTIFPPKPEDVGKYNLHKCFRILPHKQNTGGFFVAVLRKTATLPWMKQPRTAPSEVGVAQTNAPDDVTASAQPPSPEAGDAKSTGSPLPKKAKYGPHVYKEDPFIFLSDDTLYWQPIQNYFGINDQFPYTQLLGRVRDPVASMDAAKRNLFFVNSALKSILEANNDDSLKVINAGVRMFGRVDRKEQQFRLAQEGLNIILPYMSNRIALLSRDDTIELLNSETNLKYEVMSDECAEKMKQFSEGSVAVRCTYKDQKIEFCGWVGAASLSPYVAKETRLHFLRLLDFDTSELESEMVSNRKARAIAAQENFRRLRDKRHSDRKDKNDLPKPDSKPKLDTETLKKTFQSSLERAKKLQEMMNRKREEGHAVSEEPAIIDQESENGHNGAVDSGGEDSEEGNGECEGREYVENVN